MRWELTIHSQYHNKIQLLTSKSTKLRTLLIMCNLMSRLSDVKSRWAQNVRTHSYTYDSTCIVFCGKLPLFSCTKHRCETPFS